MSSSSALRILEPMTMRGLTARNRLWLPPMCMYSVEAQDGVGPAVMRLDAGEALEEEADGERGDQQRRRAAPAHRPEGDAFVGAST